MTISYIGSAAAETTSVTLPSHQAGDLLLMWAYRASGTTRPVAPAGWTYATMRANVVQAATVAYKVAASASEISGTWTNAEAVAVAVYRDSANYLSIGGVNAVSAAATTNVQFVAIITPATQTTTLNTMRTASTWVVGCVGVVSNTSDVETPPSGMTNRVNLAGAGALEVSIHDTNGDVTNWPATSHTQSVSAAYQSAVVEIVNTGVAKSVAAGGGGASVIRIP